MGVPPRYDLCFCAKVESEFDEMTLEQNRNDSFVQDDMEMTPPGNLNINDELDYPSAKSSDALLDV